MAKVKKSKLDVVLDATLNEKIEVSISNVKIGDRVYISETDDVPYDVLDIGDPFILILNTKTNFANLYKTKKIYVKKIN